MTTLLERADAARRGDAPADPYELWMLARDESSGDDGARRGAYHHAMVHAGHLVERATGRPYAVCPICDEALDS